MTSTADPIITVEVDEQRRVARSSCTCGWTGVTARAWETLSADSLREAYNRAVRRAYEHADQTGHRTAWGA